MWHSHGSRRPSKSHQLANCHQGTYPTGWHPKALKDGLEPASFPMLSYGRATVFKRRDYYRLRALELTAELLKLVAKDSQAVRGYGHDTSGLSR